MTYYGSCHCGRVAFEVEGEIDNALSCNCSMCQRKGTLMWFVPRATLTLLTPPETMATYTFNKHVIQHRFCPTCGCAPFGLGQDPKGKAMAAINVRCLDGVEIALLEVKHYDGRAL